MRLPLLVGLPLALAVSPCVHVTNCTCAARDMVEIEEAAPMLTGIVVDARGRPVADVPVRIYGGLATRRQTGETVTDEHGRYSFPKVSGAKTRPDADGAWHHYVGVSCGETIGNMNPAAYLPWTDVTIAPDSTEHVVLVLDAREVERRIAAERAR